MFFRADAEGYEEEEEEKGLTQHATKKVGNYLLEKFVAWADVKVSTSRTRREIENERPY